MSILRGVSSASSVDSNTSSSDPFLPTVEEAYPLNVNNQQVYEYALKVVLLDYINEPRFRKKYVKRMPELKQQSTGRSKSPLQTKDSERKGSSWFHGNSGNNIQEESDILQKAIPKLESHLTAVTVNKVKIGNTMLRRSLLKFYNDLFLNPDMSKTVTSMERFEELLMLFIKAANGELTKLETPHPQNELYDQVSYFISVLIQMIATIASSPELTAKLSEYKDSFKPSTPASSLRAQNLTVTQMQSSDMFDATLKPTFKLSEISHSNYLGELFGVSQVTLQQDVIRFMEDVKNDIFQKELRDCKEEALNGNTFLKEEDFPNSERYKSWQKFEIDEINSLIEKFELSKSTHNVSIGNTTVRTPEHLIIPYNARDIFTSLLCLVLQKECQNAVNATAFSKDASFFFTKCSKYWRLDMPSSKAAILYTAANLSLFTDEELDPSGVEHIFQLIHTKMLSRDEDLNTLTWNSVDQQQWLINLNQTFTKCMNSLKYLLTGIYGDTKPKFSPVLNIYYAYIESDPLLIEYGFPQTHYYKKWLKNLKRSLFKTSEEYYISLVQQVPRDHSIELYDIQNIAEVILNQIKAIQKRYSKPLLGSLNITFECAEMLIEAFATDSLTMLERVEKYSQAGKSPPIPVYDAIQTYKSLQDLRAIYSQVRPEKPFPFKLEKFFIKYLSQLCDETSNKVFEVIENSLKNETWEPVNEKEYYSSSVLDIFKMINESLNMFTKFEWGNKYQISKIYTFLLKAFADGLNMYASRVVKIIEEDLIEDQETEDETKETAIPQSAAEKMKNTWLFNEMKNALKSSSLVIPEAYEFKKRTCVCLNNLNEMLSKINELDERINAEQISNTVNKYEQNDPKRKKIANSQNQNLHQLYTVRIIRAENLKGFTNDGLANSAISLVDTARHKEIAKTKVVYKSVNPLWDEEFEIGIPANESRMISAMIWHHPSKINPLSSYAVCGKCSVLLDHKRFRNDGFPENVVLDLDTQGKLFVQISLENEKVDALFCMGRAYRTLNRACDRVIGLIVSKFSTFVNFAFSRSTLKTVCGNNGITKASKDVIYDAIVPLFDYLNANLNILATELSQELLFKIMLQAWSIILDTADSLLLPFLSSAKSYGASIMKSKTLWENAMDVAMGGSSTVAGFGRALTQNEIDVIFEWLRYLCIDFFHNNGEGPPLTDLKNQHYQNLLLIPVFYDKQSKELYEEVDRLAPEYIKYLQDRNYFEFEKQLPKAKSKRANTIARRKTIIANSSKKKRMEIEKQIKDVENDPLEISATTQDIVLRILLARGELEYVYNNLDARERISKSIATERLVKAAVSGYKFR